jgi:hypothetical protein
MNRLSVSHHNHSKGSFKMNLLVLLSPPHYSCDNSRLLLLMASAIRVCLPSYCSSTISITIQCSIRQRKFILQPKLNKATELPSSICKRLLNSKNMVILFGDCRYKVGVSLAFGAEATALYWWPMAFQSYPKTRAEVCAYW